MASYKTFENFLYAADEADFNALSPLAENLLEKEAGRLRRIIKTLGTRVINADSEHAARIWIRIQFGFDAVEKSAITALLACFYSATSLKTKSWYAIRYLEEFLVLLRYSAMNLHADKQTRLIVWACTAPLVSELKKLIKHFEVDHETKDMVIERAGLVRPF